MIRKMAVCAVIALVPTLAFAAGASAPTSNSTATVSHEGGGDTKTEAVVKADSAVKSDSATRSDAAVKTDATAKAHKVTHHRVVHKASNTKSEAGSNSKNKSDSKL